MNEQAVCMLIMMTHERIKQQVTKQLGQHCKMFKVLNILCYKQSKILAVSNRRISY